MAALDFPSTPTNGQVYSSGGRSWVYDGTSFNNYSAYSEGRVDGAVSTTWSPQL